ncbi:hypothetical protein QJQ45_023139, partial [Haematococcus lacustris]
LALPLPFLPSPAPPPPSPAPPPRSLASSAWAAAVVDGQQQQAVGVWQCRLLVAAGCRCASVHEQQQLHQAKMHVQQCMSSRRSNRL